MSYIKIVSGIAEIFSVSPRSLHDEIAQQCWPWPVTDELLANYDIYPVEDAPPAIEEYQVRTQSGFINNAGQWEVDYTISEMDISDYEQALIDRIDRSCGEFRKLFITDVPGQATTYTVKEAEADAYALDPDPEPGDYPFLESEAAATEQTVAYVAAEVSGLAAQWRALGAAIEGTRIGAKRAVTAAKELGDYAAMQAAAAVDWQALVP